MKRNSAQMSASTASVLSEGIQEAGRSVFPSLVGHWLARRTKTDQARRSSRRGTHRQLGLEVGPRIKDADIAEGKVGRPWDRHRPWMLLVLVLVLVGWTNATSRLFSFRSPSCLSWIKLRARPRDGLARAGPPFFFFREEGFGLRSTCPTGPDEGSRPRSHLTAAAWRQGDHSRADGGNDDGDRRQMFPRQMSRLLLLVTSVRSWLKTTSSPPSLVSVSPASSGAGKGPQAHRARPPAMPDATTPQSLTTLGLAAATGPQVCLKPGVRAG